MNCNELLTGFLDSIGIESSSYASAMRKVLQLDIADSADVDYEAGYSVIIQILTDVYVLNAQKVKACANVISKHFSAIGRYEKALIKHYLDYGDEASYKEIVASLTEIGATEDYVSQLLSSFREDLSDQAITSLKNNWSVADEQGDETKKFDYLQGIYTKLIPMLNEDTLSLREIFEYNKPFLEEELDRIYIDELLAFCDSDDKLRSALARKQFCGKYDELLKKDLQSMSSKNMLESLMNCASAAGTPFADFNAEQFELVAINIDQNLFDMCENENAFWNKVLSLIYYAYRVLDNHRTLAINIDNIYTKDGRNLKWMAYCYIGIYGEHFIPVKEHRRFYRPNQLCYEKCEYNGYTLNDEQKAVITQYYEGKATLIDVANALDCTEHRAKELVLDFENIWYGYMFSDCISIISGDYPQNSEIQFIRNNNQILLIFNKYRHDERKIPCPECAGLEISGNSYPEVGLKSWECKNAICPSRSKSNRGKRYSKKSNFMQWGFDNGDENDQISRSLIKNWRRDVVQINAQSEIYDMLTRYFSFNGEEVLLINLPAAMGSAITASKRVPTVITPSMLLTMPTVENAFENYFEKGDYVKRYLDQICYPAVDPDESFTEAILACKNSVLAHGDSRSVLERVAPSTITAAVTSPPYYNARLYSQWPNLYLYLSDMYEIIKQVYRTMKPGGVYLYNIGDICGNENTIVHSTMGNKRILLGAYTIHLFTAAGFELLDNVLWDKGEPQSNRQKNDGKFTPFYQKPMNVYEHMFLFKKPGAPAIVSQSVMDVLPDGWDYNIVPFTPVIKINSKGENTLGHTAPFPLDIPEFVAKVFTQSPEDIVLEPFAGSGTSIIAATRCGVKALGVELCDEYVELIKNICNDNDVPVKQIQ